MTTIEDENSESETPTSCWNDFKKFKKKYLRWIKVAFYYTDIITDYMLVSHYFYEGQFLYGSFTLFFTILPPVVISFKILTGTWEKTMEMNDFLYIVLFVIFGLEIPILKNLYGAERIIYNNIMNISKRKESNENSEKETYTTSLNDCAEIGVLKNMTKVERKKCEKHIKRKIKLSNILLLILTLEDLPQLVLQSSLYFKQGGNLFQMISVGVAFLNVFFFLWTWDKNWTKRNFNIKGKTLRFAKWGCPILSRAYVVKLSLSEHKLSTVVLLVFHLTLYTFWYIMERRNKIKNLTKYQLYDYSIASYLYKGFEAALIDFFIPRCDRYRLDFLNINRYDKFFEEHKCLHIKSYLNCLINQIIFLMENIAVITWIYYQNILTFRLFLVWISFCLGCTIFGTILVMYDLRFRIANSPVCDLIHWMRDVGKIHEYFKLQKIDKFRDAIMEYNLQNEHKKITFIVKYVDSNYQIKFIGNENQYERARLVVNERRRRNLSTSSNGNPKVGTLLTT